MGISLSGPMFESSESSTWVSSFKKTGAHYNIFHCVEEMEMDGLHQIFPEGRADELNFVLFSMSGIHGSYATIEDVEKYFGLPETEDSIDDVTFLIVQPRIVCLRYGNVKPKTSEDFIFLKLLRATSWEAIQKIGKG